MEYTSEEAAQVQERAAEACFNPYFIGIHIGRRPPPSANIIFSKFQSLFYWNTHRKFLVIESLIIHSIVSILILLEYTSEAYWTLIDLDTARSFNPYFIGIHIGRRVRHRHQTRKGGVSILILLEYTSEDI